MAQQNYLSQLTPEILQALASGQPYRTADGMYFAPRLETSYNGMDSQDTRQTGYYGGYLDPTDYLKNDQRPYGVYDMQGNLTGTGAWSQGKDWFDSPLAPLLPVLMAAGAYGLGLGSGGAGGALTGFQAGVPTAAEMAASNAAFANTLSPYLATGVPQMMGTLELIPEAAMPGTVTGYTGPTFSGLGAAAGGAGAAGGAAGAGGAGAAGSLIPGISDKALGIGATVLGGALGSQGTPDQTQEKKMDPRMDQFVYGDLMPKVQGLLTSQMPLAQQAGDQMRMVGAGLLGQPIAPNGFERFTRGRY